MPGVTSISVDLHKYAYCPKGTSVLTVLGDPVSTLLAVSSTEAGLFVVAGRMAGRGWYIEPQFAFRDSPSSLHLTVTAALRGGEQRFLADLRECVRNADPVAPDPVLLATVRALDPETLTPHQFNDLLARVGMSGGMAGVNTLLAAAPAAVRERLLTEFVGRLCTPS